MHVDSGPALAAIGKQGICLGPQNRKAPMPDSANHKNVENSIESVSCRNNSSYTYTHRNSQFYKHNIIYIIMHVHAVV